MAKARMKVPFDCPFGCGRKLTIELEQKDVTERGIEMGPVEDVEDVLARHRCRSTQARYRPPSPAGPAGPAGRRDETDRPPS